MKITLTPTQSTTLRRAPNDWQALPANLSTTALRLAGLITIRDVPGEWALSLGFQWRITPFGARVIHRPYVDKQMPDCCSPQISLLVGAARCSSSALPAPGDAKIAHPELAPWANAETPDGFTETNSVTYARG